MKKITRLASFVNILLLWSFLSVAGSVHAAVNIAVNVNPNSAQPAQQVLVDISVSNSGATTASNLIVTMVYPSGMAAINETGGLITGPVDTAASCTGNASNTNCAAGEILQWNVGTLTPGQAVQLSLSPSVLSTAVDGALIPWQATVSDDSGALGMESVTLMVDSTPALTVAIDADQDPVPVGGTLTYTLRYGNRSASSVTGTQLNFALPANTSFVSASGGGTLNGNVVNWNLATLPAGAVDEQVVQVLVNGSLSDGTLLESEAVINGNSGALPTERHATDTVYVGPGTPLALAMNVNPLPAQPSQQVLVELTVTNPTASTVFGAVVQLHYPPGMVSIGEAGGLVTGPVDTAASCTGNASNTNCAAGEILQWNVGTLTPGQAVQLSLSPSVLSTAVDGALIPWQATVSDDSGALGMESVTLMVDSTPALTVAIDADQDPVPVGGTLTYTLRYGNRSASSVTGTQLNFALPANTSFVSASGGGTLNGNVVNWNLATLPAGAVDEQVVQVLVNGSLSDGTLLESEAVINGNSGALPTERHATDTVYVGPGTPLALAMNVNPLPAQPSQQVLVELTVTNPTASTVFGAVVQLHYPPGMVSIGEAGGLVTGPVDMAASCTGTASNTNCAAGEILQWNVGTLTPGQAVQLSLSPSVLSTAVDGALIPWQATVSDDSGALGMESVTLMVDSTPALTVAIDADQDPVPVGGTLTYTLRYGNRSASSVTGTQLNFALPANTSFVSASGGGTLNGNVVNWNLATLPAGAVDEQVVQVLVNGSLSDGTLLESEAVINGNSGALPTERHATDTVYVGPGTPLALAMNVNPLPAQPSQQVLVELTVTNPTASTVFGAVVQLHYPPGMVSIGEAGGLVTGPVDTAASCTGTASSTNCAAGEILQWNVGTLTPGQAVQLSLSPSVLSTAVDGALIKWSALATEDGNSLRLISDTLPIGTCNLSDTDCDGVNDDTDNCTTVANTDQRDTDGDGYGNRCDADIAIPNDGVVNLSDYSAFRSAFGGTVPLTPAQEDADFNGDGVVNLSDYSIFRAAFGKAPGPSCCAP